jgi:hypothetical protein
MVMNKRKASLLLFFGLLLPIEIAAQGGGGGYIYSEAFAYDQFTIVVNNICLVRSTATASINLNLTTSVAGSSIAAATNSSTYLQVTSIAPATETRNIMTTITTGTIPTATTLTLAASACTTGSGTRGSVYTVPLNSTTNQTLISGICSCYTGTSSSNGYKLTFTWQPDAANYSQITATSSVMLVVTFTMAAAN